MKKEPHEVIIKKLEIKRNNLILNNNFEKARELSEKINYLCFGKSKKITEKIKPYNFKLQRAVIKNCKLCSVDFYIPAGSSTRECYNCRAKLRKIKSMNKDLTLLSNVEAFEEIKSNKIFWRFCNSCLERFPTPYHTRKQKCFKCKIQDKSYSQAIKDVSELNKTLRTLNKDTSFCDIGTKY